MDEYMPVNLTMEEMQLIKDMIEYVREHSVRGGLKDTVWNVQKKIDAAAMFGCKKHHIMMEKFTAPEGHPLYICPKCCPKEYKKAKEDAKDD